jgi:hypothetical protein
MKNTMKQTLVILPVLLINLVTVLPAAAFENLGNKALYLFPKEESVLHVKAETSPGLREPRVDSITSRLMTPIPATSSFLVIPMIGYRFHEITSDFSGGSENNTYSVSTQMASLGFIQCIKDNYAFYTAYRRNYGRSSMDLKSDDYKDSADFLFVYSPDGIYSLQGGMTMHVYREISYPVPLLGFTYYPGDYSYDIEIFLPQKAFLFYYLTQNFSVLLKAELNMESWRNYDDRSADYEMSYMSLRTSTGIRYRFHKGIYLISEAGTTPWLQVKKGPEESSSHGNLFINLIFNVSTDFFR